MLTAVGIEELGGRVSEGTLPAPPGSDDRILTTRPSSGAIADPAPPKTSSRGQGS